MRFFAPVMIPSVVVALLGCGSSAPEPAYPTAPTQVTVPQAPVAAEPPAPAPEPQTASLDAPWDRHVLPTAEAVVVVHADRLIGLKLSPLLLSVGRAYVQEECLFSTALGLQRIVVSLEGEEIAMAIEARDSPEEIMECVGRLVATPEETKGAERAWRLPHGGLAVARDDALVVGTAGALESLSGKRPLSPDTRAVVDLVPNGSDVLIGFGARSDRLTARTEATASITGDLDRLVFHAEGTTADEDLMQYLETLPIMLPILRPMLKDALGGGKKAERILELLEDLKLQVRDGKVVAELVVEDVEELVGLLSEP